MSGNIGGLPPKDYTVPTSNTQSTAHIGKPETTTSTTQISGKMGMSHTLGPNNNPNQTTAVGLNTINTPSKPASQTSVTTEHKVSNRPLPENPRMIKISQGHIDPTNINPTKNDELNNTQPGNKPLSEEIKELTGKINSLSAQKEKISERLAENPNDLRLKGTLLDVTHKLMALTQTKMEILDTQKQLNSELGSIDTNIKSAEQSLRNLETTTNTTNTITQSVFKDPPTTASTSEKEGQPVGRANTTLNAQILQKIPMRRPTQMPSQTSAPSTSAPTSAPPTSAATFAKGETPTEGASIARRQTGGFLQTRQNINQQGSHINEVAPKILSSTAEPANQKNISENHSIQEMPTENASISTDKNNWGSINKNIELSSANIMKFSTAETGFRLGKDIYGKDVAPNPVVANEMRGKMINETVKAFDELVNFSNKKENLESKVDDNRLFSHQFNDFLGTNKDNTSTYGNLWEISHLSKHNQQEFFKKVINDPVIRDKMIVDLTLTLSPSPLKETVLGILTSIDTAQTNLKTKLLEQSNKDQVVVKNKGGLASKFGLGKKT
ncbi:MAG TPA: hypothetical protein VGP47_10900 [Parachlamydiaceae bacterium]|nr:hypothetical protein [Parachlamydiaceae bacterium]